MPIITIASGKGGTGKTTTALALATLLAERFPQADPNADPDVMLLDADAQHSASWAVDQQQEAGHDLDFHVTQVSPSDAQMIAKVGLLGYRWVVIDTAAAIADRALLAALKVSDLTLMPIPPDAIDIDALIKALVEVVLPSRAEYWVVLTRIDLRRKAAAEDALEALRGRGLKVLDAWIRESAAHKRSHLEGKPITAFTGRDRLACTDYRKVLGLILQALEEKA